MIAKFAKKINEILIQKGIVQKEDAELYQYCLLYTSDAADEL